jgi:hypothetical protein
LHKDAERVGVLGELTKLVGGLCICRQRSLLDQTAVCPVELSHLGFHPASKKKMNARQIFLKKFKSYIFFCF